MHLETIRCLLWLLYDIQDRDMIYKLFLKSNNFVYILFILFHSMSMLIMLFVLLTKSESEDENEAKNK